MPNKKGKNNKNNKGKGKKGVTGEIVSKRELIFKEDMEEYAKIVKALGDRKIMVMLPDHSENQASIPGRFKKRCRMNIGDVILVSRREYQDSKLDVIHKYNPDEVKRLVKMNELPEFFVTDNTDKFTMENLGFIMEDGENSQETSNDDQPLVQSNLKQLLHDL